MRRRLVIILMTLLQVMTISGSDVKFYNVNRMFGISIRTTTSVCKDGSGFVWVSSKTGAMRIAGNDYRIYQFPFQTMDVITVNLVYQDETLLAYSNNGQIFIYDAVCDRFEMLCNMSRLLANRNLYIHSVLVDRNVIWITSSFGMYKYAGGQLVKITADGLYVNKMIWIGKGQALFVSSDGINTLDTETSEIHLIYKDRTLSYVSKLYYDKTLKRLWIGFQNTGLAYYDFESKTLNQVTIPSFPHQNILAIEQSPDSTLYVGIDGQGIREISRDGTQQLNVYKENLDDIFSLRGDGVYDILFDDDNKRVWVCTYSGGLSYFDYSSPSVEHLMHKANSANSLSNDNVNRIIEDSDSNLWFATDNGLCFMEVKTGRWKTFYKDKQEQAKVFLALCEDSRGRIWAGTYSSGVYVLDRRTGKELAHYSNDDFNCNFVFDIFRDRSDNIWIGGVNGNIICFNTKTDTFRKYAETALYCIREYSDSRMILACTFGITLFDKQTGRNEIMLDGILTNDILLYKGEIWLGTCGDGLIKFNINDRSTVKFTTEEGLPSNYVNDVVAADGYLWLGTEAGLCRFDPKDNSVQTCAYDMSLSGVSFNQNSGCVLRNGKLAFGTSNGVVMFYPDALERITPSGRIFLNDMIVSGRSVRDAPEAHKLNMPLDSLKHLTLNYNRNTVTLELLPLGSSTEEYKFAWKMDGIDADRSHPSKYHRLTYTNLPPGSFKLNLYMYDNSTTQLLDSRSITIVIKPPFWNTWWFHVILIALAMAIILFSLRYYIDRLRQKNAEDKIRFFTNIAHDIRGSLTLIKAPVEELNRETNLSDKGRQYLRMATEQTRKLSDVATQLLDFQKADIGKMQISLRMTDIVQMVERRKWMFDALAQSRNITLTLSSNERQYVSAVDETLIEKVLDNLIINAIKYSNPDSEVHIVLNCGIKNWELSVKDTGIGISRNSQKKLFREFYRSENAVNSNTVGSGIGLLLAKTYVNMHGGVISCTSRENAGSTFKIVIPYKKVEIPDESEISLNEPATTEADTESQKMYVLIVEDNLDLQQFIELALKDEFIIEKASNGKIAWDKIQTRMPDLVVSDVLMPEMDGFELCRLIKSTNETSHIPVVLLTSLTDKAQQLHGLGLGADNYLTKPFDIELVKQRIKSIIHNRHAIIEKVLKMVDTNSQSVTLYVNELNDSFVKKAIETVRENMSNEFFGKDEFAAAMCVSTSLLYKKLKSLTDQSPIEFIRSVRMKHAAELLQSGQYSITRVSEICGFSSLRYFSQIYKKHFGKPPSETK